MSDFDNGISKEQLERLAVLLEEMGEAEQVIGKIVRHGYESRHPDGGPTNRELLEKEIGHVAVAVQMLLNSTDLDESRIIDATNRKAREINRWLHHNYIASYFFDVNKHG